MATKFNISWNTLFPKLIGGTFLAMIGLVVGTFAGGIWENMGILSNLPWLEFLQFLGAICGFLLGTQITE